MSENAAFNEAISITTGFKERLKPKSSNQRRKSLRITDQRGQSRDVPIFLKKVDLQGHEKCKMIEFHRLENF